MACPEVWARMAILNKKLKEAEAVYLEQNQLDEALNMYQQFHKWDEGNVFELKDICTRLFRGKMHSDWFNGIEVLKGRWQHGEKVGYCYPSGLEKILCKWDMYVPLVMKGLTVIWC
jgi:hypothetical protein